MATHQNDPFDDSNADCDRNDGVRSEHEMGSALDR